MSRQVQEEAEEVKVIMMENMEKTEERKENVQDLDERAGKLKLKSKTAMKVQKLMKCDNLKANWKFITVVAALAVIIIIVALIMLVDKKSNPEITHESGITPMHEKGITQTTIGPGI